MAILEDVPGIEVAITVNGNDLKEHEEDDTVNEPKTVTKYIEATSGVNFGIRYSVARRFPMKGDCIAFTVYLDGQECGSSIVRKAVVKTSSSQHCRYGRNEADSTLRRFMFAALETGSSGDLRVEEDNAHIQKIGTIEVRVHHKRVISQVFRSRQREFASIGILPEKALKGQAISHNISLGESERGRGSPSVSRTEKVGARVATFIFRYRSLGGSPKHRCCQRVRKRKDLTGSVVEALKNLRIIGRTPMPVPLEECPLEELSADQLREIIRQKKDEMLRRIKPEGLERKTKREGSENGASQRKKPRIAPEYLEIDDDGTVREIKPPTQTAIRESFGR